MKNEKKRFANTPEMPEQIQAYLQPTLESAGISDANAFNSTKLVCSIAALMANKPTEFIGLAIQRSSNAFTVRLVSTGPAYNPLDDLDLGALLDSDPPMPDPDFDVPLPKDQLLKALRGSLHYYRRGENNEICYVVEKYHPKTMMMVSVAFLAALLVGGLLRLFAGEALITGLCSYLLTPLRTMFLNALKMLVVPVVFFAISSSVSGVTDIREYGHIGAKILTFYTLTSFLAILVGFGLSQLLQPGADVQLDLSAYSYTASDTGNISLIDTLVSIVPSSFVGAFTGSDMLPIIFLAALVGVAAGLLDNGEDRQKVSAFLGLCNRLFLKLASIVMAAIPVATFCSMTLLILSIDTAMIVALLKLVAGMLLGIVCMFTIYGLIFGLFVRRNPLLFFRKCIPNFISFITFCSTGAVMPQSLNTCTKRLGISPQISSFTMPLGSTINMDGACIYLTICTLFLAQVYHVPIAGDMWLKLVVTIVILSMGAPPISGAGFICLSILVLQLGIPIEGLGILMGIDQIMCMCRTLINGTGDFVGTAVVANSEGMMDLEMLDHA